MASMLSMRNLPLQALKLVDPTTGQSVDLSNIKVASKPAEPAPTSDSAAAAAPATPSKDVPAESVKPKEEEAKVEAVVEAKPEVSSRHYNNRFADK
jgi:hypothetical protein